MSKGHKHAAMMAEYARIAAEHEEPWEFFQVLSDLGWVELEENPAWCVCCEYRLKPRTIRIGDIDVPEPMRSAPEVGSGYFFVNQSDPGTVVEFKWDDNWIDRLCLGHGMCHTTKEAAIAHANALILVSGGKV